MDDDRERNRVETEMEIERKRDRDRGRQRETENNRVEKEREREKVIRYFRRVCPTVGFRPLRQMILSPDFNQTQRTLSGKQAVNCGLYY